MGVNAWGGGNAWGKGYDNATPAAANIPTPIGARKPPQQPPPWKMKGKGNADSGSQAGVQDWSSGWEPSNQHLHDADGSWQAAPVAGLEAWAGGSIGWNGTAAQAQEIVSDTGYYEDTSRGTSWNQPIGGGYF